MHLFLTLKCETAMKMTEKSIIRNSIQQKIISLPDNYFTTANKSIVQRVFLFSAYINAASVFIYLSTKSEPETDRIIDHALQSNKTVYVPKCTAGNHMLAVKIDSNSEYLQNRYAIREPVYCSKTVDPELLDLIVVPCVAANTKGARLGHGGGYYDRFLSQTNTVKLCLCFDELLCNEIPVYPHDIQMDYLITENKTVKCR